MYTDVNLWNGSMSFNKIGPQSVTVRFLLDRGATVNLLPATILKQLGSIAKDVRCPETNLHMFDGTRLQTEGMLKLLVKHPTTDL